METAKVWCGYSLVIGAIHMNDILFFAETAAKIVVSN